MTHSACELATGRLDYSLRELFGWTLMNQEKSKQPESVVDAELRQPRVYQPPKLVALGDVRDLTLGGSAGTGDSGGSGIQQF